MHVRVCRDCGEEFRPEVARCSDCGGELEDRREDLEPGPPSAAPVTGPVAGAIEARGPLHALTVAERAVDLEPLARGLGEAGIPFAVKVQGQTFALLVGEMDLAAAEERLGPVLGDAPEPAAIAEGGCPACGAGLADGTAECPGCGLFVGEPSPE